jgi:hypothetical protein
LGYVGTAAGKMGKRGGKCDLKAGHERPKTEYVQTYIGTFDRTRAGCMSVCVCHTFELMQASSNACVQCSV